MAAIRPRMFDFLQVDDVGLVPFDFRDSGTQVDGRVIRVGVIPALTKLHVELEDAKTAHTNVFIAGKLRLRGNLYSGSAVPSTTQSRASGTWAKNSCKTALR
jgi:hypothetical protein